MPDIDAAKVELAKANDLQREIWREAVAAARAPGAPAAAMTQLLPINAMIDITTTRTMASQMHPPIVIFVMLFALALAGSLLAGCAMSASKTRSWLHIIGYPLVTAVAVYVILDFDFRAWDYPCRCLRPSAGGASRGHEMKRETEKAYSPWAADGLRKLEFAIQRVNRGTVASGSGLLIDGQFLTVDEGNPLRRLVIGFGSGASTVESRAQIYQGGNVRKVLDSSRTRKAASCRALPQPSAPVPPSKAASPRGWWSPIPPSRASRPTILT